MDIELHGWKQEAAPLLSMLYSDALVVVTAGGIKLNGQVALAVLPASIVFEKPRVLLEIWLNNLTNQLIKSSGGFAIHLLKQDQFEPVRRFGFSSGREHNKFEGLAYHTGQTGSPILDDCYGWLDCFVSQQLDCKDMTVFIGEVVDARCLAEGEPLSWRKAKKTLPPDWLDEYNQYRLGNEEWARKRLR